MFELDKDHRECLLNELHKTIEAQDLNTLCIKSQKKTDNPALAKWHEIDEFLLGKKKELIEKALIENEIDY